MIVRRQDSPVQRVNFTEAAALDFGGSGEPSRQAMDATRRGGRQEQRRTNAEI
jgi:hypothetical protein